MAVLHVEEEKEEVMTPMDSTSPSSSPTNPSPSLPDDMMRRNPRERSLRDLYETTSELHLVCLLAEGEKYSIRTNG